MTVKKLIMIGYIMNIILPIILPITIGFLLFDYFYSIVSQRLVDVSTWTLKAIGVMFFLFMFYLVSSHKMRVVWRNWAFNKTDNIYLLFEQALNHKFLTPSNEREKFGLYGIETKQEKAQRKDINKQLNEGYEKGNRNADKIDHPGTATTIHYKFFHLGIIVAMGITLLFPLVLFYYNPSYIDNQSMIFFLILNGSALFINGIYWLSRENYSFRISNDGIKLLNKDIMLWSDISNIIVSNRMVKSMIFSNRQEVETILSFYCSGKEYNITVSNPSVGIYTLRRLITQYSGMEVKER